MEKIIIESKDKTKAPAAQIVDKAGNVSKLSNLITVEELKIFNNFEAIALIPRMMPFRTKLLPDYEIDYGYEVVKVDIPSRKINEIQVYDAKIGL